MDVKDSRALKKLLIDMSIMTILESKNEDDKKRHKKSSKLISIRYDFIKGENMDLG